MEFQADHPVYAQFIYSTGVVRDRGVIDHHIVFIHGHKVSYHYLVLT